MLCELPAEIVYLILAHLPTVNALANLSQTCHRLHHLIAIEGSNIFRDFVQTKFPTIETPPFWKDAAQALTSRSRALDKRGIIGRFVVPSTKAIKIGQHDVTRQDNPTLGYRPALDSYETWNGETWADRKEVLAWGAGNQLVMRIKEAGARKKEKWLLFNDLDDVSSYDDICSMHLLSNRDQYRTDTDKEHLIFSRVRGDITRLVISPNDATYEFKQKFNTNGLNVEQTDLSKGSDPTLAAHLFGGSIAFYHADTDKEIIEPFTSLVPEPGRRYDSPKLLSSSLVAVGTGMVEDTLHISTFTPSGLSPCRTIGIDSLDTNSTTLHRKVTINAIECINTNSTAGGSPGQVFLAAWGDHNIRLHDLRSHRLYERFYEDNTDLNPIYSLLSFGHDSFLAGTGGEALVKLFDLRMCKRYSYTDSHIPVPPSQTAQDTRQNEGKAIAQARAQSRSQNGFSLFLSRPPPPTFPAHRNRQRGPYRGPIYTMSSPSPSSPTVYTGIVDGIVRLDFAAADDLLGPQKELYETNLALDINTGPHLQDPSTQVCNLAGYERPDADDFTTTSTLRNQRDFCDIQPEEIAERRYMGWDCRWAQVEEPGAWRRQDL